MVNSVILNNKFSKKNSLIYKMKCINTRNEEYKYLNNEDYLRKEKYTDKSKK